MAFSDVLRDYSSRMNIELSGEQVEQFYDYYCLLVEKNKVMNLTAITEENEVITKHFLDSISLITSFDIANGSKIIDIGTGAGFPGVPLKIVRPDIDVLLLDSLQKRVGFLNECIDKLCLKNIVALHGRAEEVARDKEYREQFDYSVSRAVAKLSVLSEYAIPFLKVGGHFVSYKSQKLEEELSESKNAIFKLGGSIDKIVDVSVPGLDADRKLVSILKKQNTPNLYPRNSGKIQKEHL